LGSAVNSPSGSGQSLAARQFMLRYGLKGKQSLGLIYLIYLANQQSKTTTANKCVNK